MRVLDSKTFLAAMVFLVLYGALSVPLLWRADAAPWVIIVASLVLAVALAVLSACDLIFFRLPNALTFPLIAFGLLFSTRSGLASLGWAAASAIVGFVLLAGIGVVYRYVRERAGLGLGDAKLFAASGAWLGAQALPSVLLAATGVALVCVIIATRAGATLSGASRIPFGPFLSFGTWLVWLYGPL